MTKLIAEIGINHGGSVSLARRMVHAAAEAKCWGVKFQYRNLARLGASLDQQIGGDIVAANLTDSGLSPGELDELAGLARSLGLHVGTSFFTEDDIDDLDSENYDFFKVPSSEMANWPLVSTLLAFGRDVLVSTGMHSATEISDFISHFDGRDNLVLLHTVSNYPTRLYNAQLGALRELKNLFTGRVGYSSHDHHWETCLVALGIGVDFVERHVTLDKTADGLDQSSSSTFDQIALLAEHCDLAATGALDASPRTVNQGEKIALQNLGRGLYAKADLAPGTRLSTDLFDYRSPRLGVGIEVFSAKTNVVLRRPISAGEPLAESSLSKASNLLLDWQLDWASKNRISVPVRPRDFRRVMEEIPLRDYEFHLSFQDIEELKNVSIARVRETINFTVHVPDYLDAYNLINPFSSDNSVRQASREVFDRVREFSDGLAANQGDPVRVVASLSQFSGVRREFYREVDAIFRDLSSDQVVFSLQWLPPFAWYFGGSVPLELVNSLHDVDEILSRGIPVTLDTSHLLMGVNAGMYQAEEVLGRLEPLIVHLHVSGADGMDGEGTSFPETAAEKKLLRRLLGKRFAGVPKVLEAWQGHLNNYGGFKEAIRKISESKIRG